jgi:hypothetical protein
VYPIVQEAEYEQKVIVVLVVIHVETGKKVALVGDPKVEKVRMTKTGRYVKEVNLSLVQKKDRFMVIWVTGEKEGMGDEVFRGVNLEGRISKGMPVMVEKEAKVTSVRILGAQV